MKLAQYIETVKIRISHGLTNRRSLKFVGILAVGAILLAGTAIQFAPRSGDAPVDQASVDAAQFASEFPVMGTLDLPPVVDSSNERVTSNVVRAETSLWMKPWTRPTPHMIVVEKQAKTSPPHNQGIVVSGRDSAQFKLIELGFATGEGEKFQSFIAEADDAGHGDLLRNAGFTEQQVRNAQERQRESYEDATNDVWYQQMASINAMTELRHQGLADYEGNVNVAEADDAGYKHLLLAAGFTELQIRDAQRRQRQAYEEATHELWFQQLAEIQKKQLDNSK